MELKDFTGSFHICSCCRKIVSTFSKYNMNTSYCYSCYKQTPFITIDEDLDNKLVLKDVYNVVSDKISSFNEFNIIVEKCDLIISFKKAKNKLKKQENNYQYGSVISGILQEHNTQKKTNISKLKIKYKLNKETKNYDIQLFENDIEVKRCKTKVKDLFKKIEFKDFIAEEYAKLWCNSDNTLKKLNYILEHPHYEILIKAGIKDVYSINGFNLNKEGTTPHEILKITKNQFKFIRDLFNPNNEKTAFYLKYSNINNYLGLLQNDNSFDLNLLKKTISYIYKYSEFYLCDSYRDKYYIYNNYFACQQISLDSIVNILKISKKHNINLDVLFEYLVIKARTHQGIPNPNISFNYYYNMVKYAETLEVEFEKYPKSLVKEHDKLAYMCIKKQDEINQRKFKKQVDLNKFLEYQDEEYCIISPLKFEDLKTEGMNLGNCVGTYIDRFIAGTSKIFFMRKINEYNKSLICIELDSNYSIIQTKGYQNRNATEEENLFINKWMAHIKENIINQEEYKNIV